ncbi:MAG: GtrA family protein [Candidatus Dormibacteria bacterium]
MKLAGTSGSLGRIPTVAALMRWGGGRIARGGAFGLVGLAGLVVNQVILAILVSGFGFNYLVAAAVASQGSTVVAFAINEAWVFRQASVGAGLGPLLSRFVIFDGLNTASLLLRLPVLYVLTSRMGVNYLISNLVAVGVFMLARFAVADGWIWRQRTATESVSTGASHE